MFNISASERGIQRKMEMNHEDIRNIFLLLLNGRGGEGYAIESETKNID